MLWKCRLTCKEATITYYWISPLTLVLHNVHISFSISVSWCLPQWTCHKKSVVPCLFRSVSTLQLHCIYNLALCSFLLKIAPINFQFIDWGNLHETWFQIRLFQRFIEFSCYFLYVVFLVDILSCWCVVNLRCLCAGNLL